RLRALRPLVPPPRRVRLLGTGARARPPGAFRGSPRLVRGQPAGAGSRRVGRAWRAPRGPLPALGARDRVPPARARALGDAGGGRPGGRTVPRGSRGARPTGMA